MEKPRLLAVVGTNASGKSALGVALAKALNGEAISADSRQVYRGMDIGSGKITREEMQGVTHHLLDVCEPGAFFSVRQFQRLAYAAIDETLARGHVPLLVGGSGLYVDAVCQGYTLSDVQPDLAYRRELEKLQGDALYAMLQSAAPDTRIDSHNRNRVMRALEKLHDGDTAPPAAAPRYAALKLGVTWPRETLCARIDERLARRVQQGLIEEVERLLRDGVKADFLNRMGLEYRYVSRYLLGEGGSREEMLQALSQAIKRFAKRQMTWFRRDPSIHWLSPQNALEEALACARPFLAGTA